MDWIKRQTFSQLQHKLAIAISTLEAVLALFRLAAVFAGLSQLDSAGRSKLPQRKRPSNTLYTQFDRRVFHSVLRTLNVSTHQPTDGH